MMMRPQLLVLCSIVAGLLCLVSAQKKYGLTSIITDQSVLEILITPAGFAYAFATSPVILNPVVGATSYTITAIGVILKFPDKKSINGSFSFGIYADGGNGRPSGSPIVATTVSSIAYQPGEFDTSLAATRIELPVAPTTLTERETYWLAAACAPETPLYIYGTTTGGSAVYANRLRTLPDSTRLFEDPGMGNWILSYYLIVNTDGSTSTSTLTSTSQQQTPPEQTPLSTPKKKSKAWLIPVIIIVVIVAVLVIAAGVFFGRKYIHCGYSNAIKPHQQQLLDGDNPAN